MSLTIAPVFRQVAPVIVANGVVDEIYEVALHMFEEIFVGPPVPSQIQSLISYGTIAMVVYTKVIGSTSFHQMVGEFLGVAAAAHRKANFILIWIAYNFIEHAPHRGVQFSFRDINLSFYASQLTLVALVVQATRSFYRNPLLGLGICCFDMVYSVVLSKKMHQSILLSINFSATAVATASWLEDHIRATSFLSAHLAALIFATATHLALRLVTAIKFADGQLVIRDLALLTLVLSFGGEWAFYFAKKSIDDDLHFLLIVGKLSGMIHYFDSSSNLSKKMRSIFLRDAYQLARSPPGTGGSSLIHQWKKRTSSRSDLQSYFLHFNPFLQEKERLEFARTFPSVLTGELLCKCLGLFNVFLLLPPQLQQLLKEGSLQSLKEQLKNIEKGELGESQYTQLETLDLTSVLLFLDKLPETSPHQPELLKSLKILLPEIQQIQDKIKKLRASAETNLGDSCLPISEYLGSRSIRISDAANMLKELGKETSESPYEDLDKLLQDCGIKIKSDLTKHALLSEKITNEKLQKNLIDFIRNHPPLKLPQDASAKGPDLISLSLAGFFAARLYYQPAGVLAGIILGICSELLKLKSLPIPEIDIEIIGGTRALLKKFSIPVTPLQERCIEVLCMNALTFAHRWLWLGPYLGLCTGYRSGVGIQSYVMQHIYLQ